MSYRKADELLPAEIIQLIQQYVDGACIYIPRKEASRKKWGTGTGIREQLYARDTKIYAESLRGAKNADLAEKYFLSEKSIQRIIYKIKQEI